MANPSFHLRQFVRRQQSFIAVAVAIYGALWAMDRQPEVGVTLAYTLPLGNLIALVQDQLGFLYKRRLAGQSWAIYLSLLFAIAILGVGIVNVLRFPLQRDGQTLWQFLASGWKFPFMATIIVGVSTELYRRMREQLETRNRELQQKVELEAADRELRSQELQQAREIQQSLLPKQIPCVAGFEIECAWEPAQIVGGDYFDIIGLSDTRLGICIADVVGKSVSAALLMANVQASVRAFAAENLSPADLCGRVNSVLCSSIDLGKYVTLFYGVLDAERRTFHYTNAGHLPPILIRGSGKIETLSVGGPVLGVFLGRKYEVGSLQFDPGDRLLLFTDGITEAGLPDAEEFGEQRIIDAALKCANQSAGDLKASLFNEVRQYSSPLKDDATFIVISALPFRSTPADRTMEEPEAVSASVR